MSPHAVNSFVSDLVTMAQAMERLPQVEAELADTKSLNADWITRFETLRADLQQAKDYAISLEQRLHDAEVAKDAAETMFLEADDRTARALDFVKAQFGAAGSLIQALEPVKVKPGVEETVQHEQGPSLDDWKDIDQRAEPIISEVKPIAADWELDKAETSTLPSQGQSEPDPISSSPEHPDGITNSESVSAASSWTTPAAPDTKPQPYAGRKYKDVPYYVPLDLWLDGGGKKLDYSY